jgi:hypothetical protein
MKLDDYTVPEHGIDEYVEVTVTCKETEVKILLLRVYSYPVEDEMLKSVAE